MQTTNTTTIRYYVNDQHIDGWDEPATGDEDLQTVADAAEDNLTDYQPGDVLTVERGFDERHSRVLS